MYLYTIYNNQALVNITPGLIRIYTNCVIMDTTLQNNYRPTVILYPRLITLLVPPEAEEWPGPPRRLDSYLLEPGH